MILQTIDNTIKKTKQFMNKDGSEPNQSKITGITNQVTSNKIFDC